MTTHLAPEAEHPPLQQLVTGLEIEPKPKRLDYRDMSGAVLRIASQAEGLEEATTTLLSAHNALEQARKEAQFARTDSVTKLPNRGVFDNDFVRFLRRERATPGQTVGLLIADIDGLKRANDELGHSEGDRLLRTFASSTKSILRPGDQLYRIGGDEFGVLMKGSTLPTDREEQIMFEKSVRARFSEALADKEFPEDLMLGVSVAFATHNPHESPENFFDRVDSILRGNKRASYAEHGVEFYDSRNLPR